MRMERILVVYNKRKSGARELAGEIAAHFEGAAVSVMEVDQLENGSSKFCADLAFSLGGDGTALTCCRALSDCQRTPIIAVNMGSFGYITEVAAKDWRRVCDLYTAGRLPLAERRMLTCSIQKGGAGEFTPFSDALNDIVVSGSGISKIIRLEMRIDSCFGGSFRSDGVIVASPTGSTAYSLAAGGPILDPLMDALVVTPICPFSLSNRPIVVRGGSAVEFRVCERQRTGIRIDADGQVAGALEEGDRVRIQSLKRALFVDPGNGGFIQIIREKLRWDG